MMFVRVNDVWKGLSSPSSPLLSFNQSQAQQPPPPGGRKPGQPSPTMPDRSATGGGAATAPPPAPSAPTPSPASPAAPVTGGEAAPPAGGEPPTFTQNEIDVLQKLSERRESLDARQHDLDLRENMIKAAEARIDKKIAEMKSLQASVEGILKQVDDQDDAKLKSLVKIYETMKPKDAARIFEGLDMPVLLGVISRMKEQKVAPVMEAMSADKAKAITDALAARRSAKAEGKGG
jgi:flagellar motility protein MotE (MotC chaperone)